MKNKLTKIEPWSRLTEWTPARIALGRAGVSTPTSAMLEFNSDHALARHAIYASMPVARMEEELAGKGLATISVTSRVHDRSEYLRRPDLGRLLTSQSARALHRSEAAPPQTLSIVVADGLSALAPVMHAPPLIDALRKGLNGWSLDAIVLATGARVALGDEIGAIRGAEAVVVLIGERPGLKSPDSLGAYLTYRPRPGRMDSERNCISNIRPAGLSYMQAAFRLLYLLHQSRLLGASGVVLKDESDRVALPPIETSDTEESC
ncbi:ethanolamine ammonia-lyase subunit EutC [Edaphobacter sp. 12200R-103]|jgi:ethanolamine ammonia-lyase small subunit|uniref:ethanolamine ammonia-lyase subunit EutC n=1 Tax=Edaphobacter sp. 12200R-103 TaxID=2703788 RepID=UPI00138BB6AD|nr:ethanolamine ammonia-lyase subunit EutC [Edaphobacter sp. 12200R-103]QHS51104.1 ethanolamine ammonia-lyase subunit EutC [Edaphobacter sp. 12200R-103]